MYLPLMFKSDGMRCLIIGGGEVAWRKLELLLKMKCNVTIISPRIGEGIRSAIDDQKARWIARNYQEGDCHGYQLVIAATASRKINQSVFDESSSLCIPVNVVDDPERCSVIFPAVWQQGALTISVSTEGAAPFMAAAVRDRLAEQSAHLPEWIECAARFRAIVRKIENQEEKSRLYAQFVNAAQTDAPPDPPQSSDLRDWELWLEKRGR